MNCRIDKTSEMDVAAWVSREAFFSNIDREDLACRESQVILDWYHPKWFRSVKNGELYFTPPAFVFRSQSLLCINGRHRTILLFRHLDPIPMLLVLAHEWPKEKLTEIMKRRIGVDEVVTLPNLPINELVR